MRAALTLMVLLAAPVRIFAQAEGSGSPPEVAGYRLGADWQNIGRLMPCRSGPNGLTEVQKSTTDRHYPQLLAELRICEPSDSVNLYFFRDTLFRIGISRFFSNLAGPTETWNQQKDWAVEMLGKPDSVVARSASDFDWVTAHWDRTRSRWRARLFNAGGCSHFDIAYCEFLPAVCEAIFRDSNLRRLLRSAPE